MERKLCLSARDRKIAGVCGGVAAYFQLDSLLVRIAFILLVLMFRGTPIIVYLICWGVIPAERY